MPASSYSLSRSSVALVVESDPSLRRLMSTILRQTGYDVHEHASATSTGSDDLDDWSVQLLVVGLTLSGGDSGLELAKDLWQRNPDARIIVTGVMTPDENDMGVVREAGMTFLSLPCSFARLSRAASPAMA